MTRIFLLLIATVSFLIAGCNSGENREDSSTENSNEEHKMLTMLSPQETGIRFRNDLPVPTVNWNSFIYFNFYNGGGVSVGDINSDGLPDIYFVGNSVRNKLYLNKGDLTFEDITEKAGIGGTDDWSTGTTMADVNGDGLLDIYVCTTGKWHQRGEEIRFLPEFRPNQLYINNGDGTFDEKAAEYGIADMGFSNHASFFDYDLDGDLDLYVMNHPLIFVLPRDLRLKNEQNPTDQETDRLYRNNGDGTFTDVTDAAGIREYGFGLSVNTADLNNDGWPDIYVANDFDELDRYYVNNGDGTFTDQLKTSFPHVSQFSMGSDVADFNNDGLLDLLVVDMMAEDNRRKKINMAGMSPEKFQFNVEHGLHFQYMQNVLQMNNGNNTFSDVAEMCGVANTDWSWSALFGDLDNDGRKDIFVSNGQRKDIRNNDFTNRVLRKYKQDYLIANAAEISESIPEEPVDNHVYRNKGGIGFEKANTDWITEFKGYSNGAALADLDNDGDLDLVLNNVDHEALIFENRVEEKNFLSVKLNGSNLNKYGIGARVVIRTKSGEQSAELSTSRGFLSSADPVLHFGLGKDTLVEKLQVIWPGGKSSEVSGVNANQIITLSESEATGIYSYQKKIAKWFKESTVNHSVNFRHREIVYDDYKKEVLLPHKYSQLGPALATGDVNGDGLDDFYMGGAHQQPGKLFVQLSDGGFREVSSGTWENDKLFEDVNSLLFDADNDGDDDLYVVSGSNEWDPGSELYQDRLYRNDGKGNFTRDHSALPLLTGSGSCIRSSDLDGDGDLDLFLGGRIKPGLYPYPVKSYILVNENGSFRDETDLICSRFNELGLVTDAQWADLDGDNDEDLVVVGEWMSPRFFYNESGKLNESTDPAFAAKYSGWWYSVETADMDNDGDLDLIAGNLGMNSKYNPKDGPVQVYSGDFDNNGSNDIVLGYYNFGVCYPVRGRECSSQQMPVIKEKFKDYQSFGTATLEDVYGKQDLSEALHYSAGWMFTSYIENKGNGEFEVIQLPDVSQVSAVNGIIIDDIDNDGNKDVILAGNMHHAEVETCRHDASVGSVLKGDGTGKFTPHYLPETGLYLPGDVKDIELVNGNGGLKLILVSRNDDNLSVWSYENRKQL